MVIQTILTALLFFLLGIFLGLKIVKPKEVDGTMVLDDSDPDVDKIELQLETDPEEVDIYILKVERTRHK